MYILSEAHEVSVHKPVVATFTPEENINLLIIHLLDPATANELAVVVVHPNEWVYALARPSLPKEMYILNKAHEV